MNELVGLRGAEPSEILRTVIDKKVPAIMSFLSRGKWHVAKVRLTELGTDRFSIESTHWTDKPHPINIQVSQPVGISFKHEYGKFVFDTIVLGLELSSNSIQQGCGGTIVLAVPSHIEMIHRRSYFRVDVPQPLKVSVVLWHRTQNSACGRPDTTSSAHPIRNTSSFSSGIHHYYQGRLIDISAGGAQVEVNTESTACETNSVSEYSRQGQSSSGQSPAFRNGQFVGLRFTPLPYETPLVLNAQIRHILPAAGKEGDKTLYLGLQIVGLESSREGREVLSRLVGVVERYHRMNRSDTGQSSSFAAQIADKNENRVAGAAR